MYAALTSHPWATPGTFHKQTNNIPLQVYQSKVTVNCKQWKTKPCPWFKWLINTINRMHKCSPSIKETRGYTLKQPGSSVMWGLFWRDLGCRSVHKIYILASVFLRTLVGNCIWRGMGDWCTSCLVGKDFWHLLLVLMCCGIVCKAPIQGYPVFVTWSSWYLVHT